MVFTYDDSLASDADRVRFWTGDTVEATHQLSDALITALIDEETDYKGATIAALEYLLVKINREPDTTADWLRIAWGGSREGLETQLRRLQKKWSKGYKRTGSSKRVSRYDLHTD